MKLDPITGIMDGEEKVISLRNMLDEIPVLDSFKKIPSKENGIDIEGIASDGEQLYLGLRGPVLRFGLSPVVVFNPDQPGKVTLRYVMLGGRGIRDITRVKDGFLILAGAVGDVSLSTHVYFWDGNDCFPGKRSANDPKLGRVVLLGSVLAGLDKAEAITILKEDREAMSYEFLVLFDGPDGGNPMVFSTQTPESSN